MSENELHDLRSKIKKYLEIDNVSILAGAGTSFHLGAPIIRTIPEELKTSLEKDIEHFFDSKANPSFEDLFNCLQAERFLLEQKNEDSSYLFSRQHVMQKWLFDNCNTEKTVLSNLYEKDERLQEDRYYYHELFIKKLLQRPINLKRANLFTTNYDMAFDYALDKLGVFYINGFLGVHDRVFHPEIYDFDLYYPGQSVSGKVHRAEKVLRYYKLHGSLSWISDNPSRNNTYGIKEISLHDSFDSSVYDNKQLMVYPCSSKKSFTLDLPYSELFRQFASAINQPQSVLICLGYSFNDEHINDLIYHALTNPSFTLIIVNYNKNGKEGEILRLDQLGDSRIIVINPADGDCSTFVGFVKNVMPDLYEEDEDEIITKTMCSLYPARTIMNPGVINESN